MSNEQNFHTYYVKPSNKEFIIQLFCHFLLFYSLVFEIQLYPTNSNSVISNSPLFRTKTHFPWTCPSVIYYWLFRTPDISNYSSLPLTVRNSGVQLYNLYHPRIISNSLKRTRMMKNKTAQTKPSKCPPKFLAVQLKKLF